MEDGVVDMDVMKAVVVSSGFLIMAAAAAAAADVELRRFREAIGPCPPLAKFCFLT